MNIIRHALWLLTLCLCGCGLAMAGSVSYTLTPDLSTFSLTDVKGGDGNDYTRIVWPGMDLPYLTGSPELPYQNLRFLVPTFSRNFSVSIRPVRQVSINLNHPLYPTQLMEDGNELHDPHLFIPPNICNYEAQDSVLNGEFVREDVMSDRYHMVDVRVPLASYSYIDSEIIIFTETEIVVNFQKCNSDEMSLKVDIDRTTELPIPLESLVVNPDDQVIMVPTPISRTQRTNLGQNQDEYWIIAPAEYNTYLDDLIRWKQQKGLKVFMVAIEDIYRLYPIDSINSDIKDKAASLRMFLRQRYEQRCGDMYVLLIGNPTLTDMPIRYQYDDENPFKTGWDQPINTEHFIPTDSYFANVTQPWPLTYNSKNRCYVGAELRIWYKPEIMIGRLPCNNLTDLANYVDKLILYEANPGRGNTQYLNRAFSFEQDGSKNHGSLLNRSDELYDVLLRRFQLTCFKDKGQSEIPQEWPTGPDVIAEMKMNGFNSWNGHGNPVYVGTSAGIQPDNKDLQSYALWHGICALEGYSSNDRYGGTKLFEKRVGEGLDNLNNPDSPSIVYSISCTNAPLDIYSENGATFNIPYNLAASFTLGKQYGGPAFIGNSRLGYITQSINLELQFAYGMGMNPCIGRSMNFSKSLFNLSTWPANYVRHCNYLTDDPEFNIWYGAPYEFTPLIERDGNTNFRFEHKNLNSSKIIQFDGQGNFIIHASNNLLTMSCQVSEDNFKSSPIIAYGIWKGNYLPIIGLRNCYGRIDSGRYSYVVRDAILGTTSVNSNSFPTDLELANNTKISIKAIDKVMIGDGVKLSDDSSLLIRCDRTTELGNCCLTDNSNCEIYSQTTSLTEGFSMEAGTTLIINPI